MYTKTKINNLTKNNKILYEKDGWKLTAIYDYEGLIGEAIFNNHFTKTCLRNRQAFFRLTNFSLINKEKTETIKHKISLLFSFKEVVKHKVFLPFILKKLPEHEILLPVYILKNEKLKYFRQIEVRSDKIKIYDQLNVLVWIRKKDIPSDIRTILSFLKLKNDNIVFLNEENFFIEKFLKKEKNVEIYRIKNVYNSDTFKFKNNNDYFILSEHILINNINKNKILLLFLLTKLKHYKYRGDKPISQIIREIFKNKQVVKI